MSKVGSVTRYLAAAAHLDDSFADYFHRHLLDEPCKALVDSDHVDWELIARHAAYATARAARYEWLALGACAAGLFAACIGMPPPVTMAVLVAVGALVEARRWWSIQSFVRTNLTSGADPLRITSTVAGTTVTKPVAEALSSIQYGNLVVFAGADPFVGSGLRISGWSFALDVHSPKAPGTPTKPFDLSEVYDALGAAIGAKLKSVEVADRLYVRGDSVRNDSRFLTGHRKRPVAMVNPAEFPSFLGRSNPQARVYRMVRWAPAQGAIELAVLFRAHVSAGYMFFEVENRVVPPVADRFRAVDQLRPTIGGREFWRRLPAIVLIGALRAAMAPASIFGRYIGAPWNRWSRQQAVYERVEVNEAHDYGATDSLRGHYAAQGYDGWFQSMDCRMVVRVVERLLLDGLSEFLDAHGIATGELNERRTTILNYGILVQGGALNAQNVAAGTGAAASGGAVAPSGA